MNPTPMTAWVAVVGAGLLLGLVSARAPRGAAGGRRGTATMVVAGAAGVVPDRS